MPECTGANAGFRPLGRRRIDTAFDGGNVTSDGGALFVREVDEKFDLSRRIAECLTDPRRQASCEHTCRDLVRQLSGPALPARSRPENDDRAQGRDRPIRRVPRRTE